MTDSPPKRRVWFQLHLSTCVVLMVVAGVLIWLNVTKSYRSNYFSHAVRYEYAYSVQGWPWIALVTEEGQWVLNGDSDEHTVTSSYQEYGYQQDVQLPPEAIFAEQLSWLGLHVGWNTMSVLKNLAVVLLILFAVALLIESSIRKHEDAVASGEALF